MSYPKRYVPSRLTRKDKKKQKKEKLIRKVNITHVRK